MHVRTLSHALGMRESYMQSSASRRFSDMMIVPSIASLRSTSVDRTTTSTFCIRSISWRRKMFSGCADPIFFRQSFTCRRIQSIRVHISTARRIMQRHTGQCNANALFVCRKQWRSQDLEVGGTGGLGNGSPPAESSGRATGGWFGGGIASRKLIAVIKDIWLPNHAQF